MPKGDRGRWTHPDANEVDQEDHGLGGGGSYAVYVCPNCELRFRVELPD
jgi:hypothetical protein